MDIDYKIIGKRLKEARRKKGLTQDELSEKLDLSIAYLSRLENGTGKINLNRLLQICNILEVSAGEILLGVTSEDRIYLNKELAEVLQKCDGEKQRLIYEIAKLVEEG